MSDGTLQTLDVTMLDDVNNASGLIQLDSNAKIPACSAAAVTNLPGITKSSSDPTISTNPSGGVGTVYQNTTSGEMYVCTDATAGANVWTNVGAGSGDVEPWTFQGTQYGYATGGYTGGYRNDIQKYSLSSDANGTDVGDLLATRRPDSSQADDGSYGFSTGTSSGTYINVIERFSFLSDGNSTDWADLSAVAGQGATAHNQTHGYYGGVGNAAYSSGIDKFPLASQTNGTDIGNLTVGRDMTDGCSSATYGFAMGGSTPYSNVIDKWSFSADGNATDHGDLLFYMENNGACSSTTHGYVVAGYAGSPSPTGNINTIQKFQFASNSNATDVGDMITTRKNTSGASSTTHGYSAGGNTNTNGIEKFSFTTDGNATDVADLIVGLYGSGSNSY